MRTGFDGAVTPTIFEPTGDWVAGGPDRPLAGLTVLLVEDSRLASEAMRLLCLRSGARIRRADCLRSADRHLRSYNPRVVIVDMGLPDGDGAALIARVNAVRPRPAVLLGLSGDPDRRAEAMAAGADGFLAKPVNGLAAFQQAILDRMPASARPRGLRLLSDALVAPDAQALRDDLAHLAVVLRSGTDTGVLDYAARFLAGLAQVAHDPVLAQGARDLSGPPDREAQARVLAVIEQRLSTTPIM